MSDQHMANELSKSVGLETGYVSDLMRGKREKRRHDEKGYDDADEEQ